ncbi:hypothetical protein ACUCL8_005406, partial [Escherichia coli]
CLTAFNNKRCIFIPAICCLVFIPLRWGFTLEPVYLYFIRQPEQLAPAAPAEKTDGARYQILQFG